MFINPVNRPETGTQCERVWTTCRCSSVPLTAGMGWSLCTTNADDDDYGACDEDDKQNGKGAPFYNERETWGRGCSWCCSSGRTYRGIMWTCDIIETCFLLDGAFHITQELYRVTSQDEGNDYPKNYSSENDTFWSCATTLSLVFVIPNLLSILNFLYIIQKYPITGWYEIS